MWQLRKLSTNEALSEAGPLPNNWGPIFGLEGFIEKLGDLSWIGPDYADTGWVELSAEEIKNIKENNVLAKIETEKIEVKSVLNTASITVEQKQVWNDYLLKLNTVCLEPNFEEGNKFPIRPIA